MIVKSLLHPTNVKLKCNSNDPILPEPANQSTLPPPSVSNYSIKTIVLILLCCQNSGHALLTRYSQGILRERYSSTG